MVRTFVVGWMDPVKQNYIVGPYLFTFRNKFNWSYLEGALSFHMHENANEFFSYNIIGFHHKFRDAVNVFKDKEPKTVKSHSVGSNPYIVISEVENNLTTVKD